jgi:hypothetical protein
MQWVFFNWLTPGFQLPYQVSNVQYYAMKIGKEEINRSSDAKLTKVVYAGVTIQRIMVLLRLHFRTESMVSTALENQQIVF